MSEFDDKESVQVDFEQSNEITPAEAAEGGVNTWSKPIGLITWGLLLTSFHINHLYLQYILPTIGVLLFYCGARSVRCENKWFRATWIFAIVMMAYNVIATVISATPLNNIDPDLTVIGTAYLIFQLSMLLSLRKALQSAFNKFGHRSKRNPLSWACLWTIIILILAMLHTNSPIVFLLLIWIIAIYMSLSRIGPELDEVGYRQTEPPVKMGGLVLSSAYVLLFTVVVGGCCVYFNHLPLEPKEYQQPEMTENRTRLVSLGFPEEILKDLTNEDMLALGNAVKIQAGTETLEFNSGGISNPKMDVTTIYIELPGKELYNLHYYKWLSGNPYWQDGISIWADDKDANLILADSSLLYEKNGVTYKAAFPTLKYGNVTTSSIFFGDQQLNQFTGVVSYPFGSQNQRGYVLYHMTVDSNKGITCAALTCLHMRTPINIPYKTADEKMLSGDFSDANRRQSYTTYEFKANP